MLQHLEKFSSMVQLVYRGWRLVNRKGVTAWRREERWEVGELKDH